MGTPGRTILVVDDHTESREAVARALQKVGWRTITASGGREALDIVARDDVDIVITDLKMPDLDGMALLEVIKEHDPQVAAIVMTAYGTVDSAVEAMRLGAYDYLVKPINLGELRLKVDRAVEQQSLVRRVEVLSQQLGEFPALERIVGTSAAVERLRRQIGQVAPLKVTVLIRGESGTGKELVASAIHHLSPRHQQPFLAVNCSALPEGLLESHLFGHERGAFTGAVATHKGIFEAADRGTLFLDEIGDMALPTQSKLLRLLEEQTFTRVGGAAPITADVRLIAATNADLEMAIQAQRFRRDLYYRLDVVSIDVPPLRERPGDIPLLLDRFLTEFTREHNRPVKAIAPEVVDLLTRLPWPGNIRELKHTLERLLITVDRERVTLADLPKELLPLCTDSPVISLPLGIPLEEAEREIIRRTLDHTAGNRTHAARLLHIGLRTIQRKMRRYNLL